MLFLKISGIVEFICKPGEFFKSILHSLPTQKPEKRIEQLKVVHILFPAVHR